METSIDLYSRLQDPMAACDKLGEWLSRSGLYKARNEEQGKMIAFLCMVEKKSPTELLRENHIMDNGQLVPKSRNVHARFLQRGGDVEWISTGDEPGEFDALFAEAIFRFSGRERKVKFSITDARRQQLQVDKENGVWRKTPGKMLRARVLTNGIDLFCPDIVLGMPDDEMPSVAATESKPTINLEPQADTVAEKPAEKKKPVEIVIEPKSEEKNTTPSASAETPKPVEQESTPTTNPEPAKPTTFNPTNGNLPDDVVSKLESVIGANSVQAMRWFVGNGKIKQGEGLEKVPASTAAKIIEKPQSFLRAIETWNKGQIK